MFRKRDQNKQNTVQEEFRLCTGVKIMNPSVSVKNRSLRDSSRMRTRTRTRYEPMDACLSFTTVLIFTYTDTYTDHRHGSQFTDVWMASLSQFTVSRARACYRLKLFRLTSHRLGYKQRYGATCRPILTVILPYQLVH